METLKQLLSWSDLLMLVFPLIPTAIFHFATFPQPSVAQFLLVYTGCACAWFSVQLRHRMVSRRIRQPHSRPAKGPSPDSPAGTATWTCLGCGSHEVTERIVKQIPASFKYYCLCDNYQFVCRACYDSNQVWSYWIPKFG